MDRDTGMRRTAAITTGLVAASVAGVLAVGVAAHAESTQSTEQVESDETRSTTDSTYPSVTGDSDSGGQATSGGS